MQNVCPKCRPYILTNSTEDREIQQMKDLWMEISGIVYPDTVMMKSHSGKDDFRHVFSRLIGFSSMTFKIQKIGAHQQIMGTYAPKIVGGWTKALKLTYGKKNEPIRYGDVMGRQHDAYQLIFWNPKQLELLEGKYKLVIFFNDFGSGENYFLIAE